MKLLISLVQNKEEKEIVSLYSPSGDDGSCASDFHIVRQWKKIFRYICVSPASKPEGTLQRTRHYLLSPLPRLIPQFPFAVSQKVCENFLGGKSEESDSQVILTVSWELAPDSSSLKIFAGKRAPINKMPIPY